MDFKKHHHTVPRCYLQNFTDGDGFVWILDTKDKIFRRKPESILVENHFYTVTLKNGEKSLFVEDTLANIESEYATIFNNKISQDLFLTDEERAKVSVFIAALMLRTRPRRESMKGMFQNLKKSMEKWQKESKTTKDTPETLKTASAISSSGNSISIGDLDAYLDNYKEEHSVSILNQLPKVAQLIFNMKWSVWKNADCNFVTCDDPLVLLRPASIKKYGANAFGSTPGLVYQDVELTLPLSKDRLLLAGWILEEDSYLPIENDMAERMNYRTITRSSERVIASSKLQAEAIKNKYTETIHKHTKSR